MRRKDLQECWIKPLPDDTVSMENGKSKVCVIGAGAAGLTAANKLKENFHVEILEARSRIGGRCYTSSRKYCACNLECDCDKLNLDHGKCFHYFIFPNFTND